ncbi:MAG: Ig-like domain-containing protein, partial [Methylotenera sp.]|nr:Ig-like domain-containing protein [Methylotenera sp.]
DTKAVSAVNGLAANVGAASVAGTYGSITIAANGVYTYTLNNSLAATQALDQGQVVTDVFNYTVIDANGATSSVNINVSVTGTNDAPIAVTDTYSMAEDSAAITLTPLTGDTDPDGTTPSILSINGTTLTPGTAQTIAVPNGVVNVSSAGIISFTPALNFNGTVSFPYVITDGSATATANQTITVTAVNDAPVAVADTAPTLVTESGVNPGNTAFAGTPSTTGNVLSNDTDVDTGDTKTVNSVNGLTTNVGTPINGTYGSISIAADGTYTYTLNNSLATTQALAQGQAVTEVFNYTLKDTANAVSNSTTLTINISGTNDAPVAVVDNASVVEAGVNPGNTAFAGTATASGNVLTNDTDVDTGDTKAVSAVNGLAANVGAASVAGTYGSITIAANGVYTYTLNNSLAAT